MSGRIGIALLLGGALLAGAPPAAGYVRTMTDTGHPMAWGQTSLSVTLYAGDPPPDLTREVLVNAARAAAATWSHPSMMCTSLALSVSVADEAEADASFEQVNRITFRRREWRKIPCDPLKDNDCDPYPREALAITSVWARKSDGTILDVDMEINAVNFRWADVLLDGRSTNHDIQNVLTHEFGHFIGLDHTCHSPGDKTYMRDQNGEVVPNCSAATADVQATTMYASASPGDVQKRSLEPDDARAACDIYPPVADDGGCALGGRAGRQSAAPGPGAIGLLFALAIARALRRRIRGGRESGHY